MEKVYLLLRKNQQTGPYTYEELLQQQLLPTDLIWVEGKSSAWFNPEELKKVTTAGTAVKPSSPEATGRREREVSSKNAPDSMPWYLKKKSPEAELEERALALRERAQAAASTQTYHPAPTMRPSRKQVVYQEEESPLLLEVHTINKKSVTLPQLIAAGVITALVAAGWYNREVLHMVRPQQNLITQAAAPAVFQVSLPTPPKPTIVLVTDTVASQPKGTIPETAPLATATVPRTAQQTKPQVAEAKQTATGASETATASITTSPAVTEKKDEAPTKPAETSTAEKKDTAKAVAKEATNDTEVEQATTTKKKGLGQAIKNIFKKKKKSEEKQVEEKEAVE